MNHIYDPINAVKIIVGIEIANDIFNESMPPNTSLGSLYYMYDNKNNFIEGIKTIYEKISHEQ